jgi:GntR family transcriptional regulator
MDDVKQASRSPALRVEGQEGIPKYVLLRNTLLEEIASGRWGPGDRLPAEDQLAEMTSLSVGTVQRSLRMLVDEGRLVRRHGTGTFVASEQRPLNAPFQHCRFIDEATGQTLPIFSRVVRRRELGPQETGRWSKHVPGDRVVCLERTFSIDHEFMLYTHLYFDRARLPELATMQKEALNGVSLKDLLSREYHLTIARYDEKLSVRVFPDEVCKAIKAGPKTAGAVLELVAYDRRGAAVYFQDFFIPPNERRLLITA